MKSTYRWEKHNGLKRYLLLWWETEEVPPSYIWVIVAHNLHLSILTAHSSQRIWTSIKKHPPTPYAPRSRPCSLKEQYFKCGIFWDYDAPQRRVSNSEAPVLAGGIPVFLRGSQFSGASELKEGPVSKYKFINTTRLQLSYFCDCTIDLTQKWLYLHTWRLRVRVLGGIGFHHTCW